MKMRGNAKVFPYALADGGTYSIWINLAPHPETGKYDGLAQVYEGEVENSAYVGNGLTIPPLAASSEDDAYREALAQVCRELESGTLRTPGVLGRRISPDFDEADH